jgi:carbonic anhydrase
MFDPRRRAFHLADTALRLSISGCAGLLLVACRTAAPAASSGETAASALPSAEQPASSARPAHWGYAGDEGAAHWSSLSTAYEACADTQQSPIDLTQPSVGSASWAMNYRKTGLTIAHHEHVTDILDNGHTIQVTVNEGSTLTTASGTYMLKQFHFHTPSEHTIDGQTFPMEVHFVHQSSDGRFAVLAVFVDVGPANENLAMLIDNFPAAKGDTHTRPEVVLELGRHLPPEKLALNYVGSFTTPPCTENVEWVALIKPVPASSEQIAAFAARLHQNNRPIQSLNGRAIARVKLESSVGR